jgi:hypothetical protein
MSSPISLRRAGAFAAALAAPVLLPASALAADTNGAAGSPISQIIIATGSATLLTLVLLWVGLGHRSGRVQLLNNLAAYSERKSGLPGWCALPVSFATGSLLIAVFGMYWDISLHIDVGRDPGPLANPAHYFILLGLFGIFTAGYLAIMLPSRRGSELPGPTGLHLTPRWKAPLGGVLICACGVFALIGFPLDDVWHRLFGQDVTLWGPTHLMLIGGASMTLIGIGVLMVEGARANAALALKNPDAAVPARVEKPWVQRARQIALSGGLLLGLSTFQAEFDFGIPQFRFVFEPVMLMIASTVGLVSVRVWSGKWSAFGAVAFFLAVRAIVSLLVGPVLGETTPAAPLYLAEAILVEGVALVLGTQRTLRFALVSGFLIGTIGLAAEWAWSHVIMPYPMPSTLVSDGVPFGFVAAMSGALVGGWIGSRLMPTPEPGKRPLRIGAVLGAIGIAAIFALGLPKPPIEGDSATVTLSDATIPPGQTGSGGRAVLADIQLSPVTAADDAKWLSMTSWQGDGIIIDHLKKVGPGHYRSTKPAPVFGHWKSLIRMQVGRAVMAVPVFLPLDTAIPAAEVPALPQFTRPLIADHKVMQREQVPASGLITNVAYIAIGSIAFLLLVLLVWGLHRLGAPPAPRQRQPKRSPAPARTTAGTVAPSGKA